MKKFIVTLLCIAALFAILTGCVKNEDASNNVAFTAVIEEVYENSILVTTSDEVGFDKASVSFEPEIQIPFDLVAGQTIKLTILPQIAESYPVQVRAVAIELVSGPDAR